MSGIKALRRIQIGLETTAGTAVSATTRWRGTGTLQDTRKVVFVPEDIGYLSGVDRTHVPQLGAKITLEDTPATFEQLPYLLAMGVKNVIAGSSDTGGAGKIYTFTGPTTAKNTIKTATIEGGDDQEAERMEYAFAESIRLSFKQGDGWSMGADLIGRQVSLNAFAGGATLPTVEEMDTAKLYLDAVAGPIGTTVKAQALLSAEFAITTGWHAKFTADGQLYYSYIDCRAPEITAKAIFVHGTVAAAEKVNWRAQTGRLLRVLAEGSAFTAGSGFSKKTAIFDFAGKWEMFEKLGEQDGNDVVGGLFRARYNATAAKFFEAKVVNLLASLP